MCSSQPQRIMKSLLRSVATALIVLMVCFALCNYFIVAANRGDSNRAISLRPVVHSPTLQKSSAIARNRTVGSLQKTFTPAESRTTTPSLKALAPANPGTTQQERSSEQYRSIKIALYNDRLIKTQWGLDALKENHGFSGNIPCPLVEKCNFRIISDDLPKSCKKCHAIVHMAAKPSNGRMVSFTRKTKWGGGIRSWFRKKKQYKLLYAGEGNMESMDNFKTEYRFDGIINYRLSSDGFLGHGGEAIRRMRTRLESGTVFTRPEGVSLYDPKSVFERSGDIAIFVSNCSGERMKWIEYLINFAKALKNGTLAVDSYGKCFHNVDDQTSRHQKDWYAAKLKVLKKYKFSVAFENSNADSYVTEKIFMALEAGTVPLYYGTEKVKFMVPSGAAVHTNSFPSNEKGMEKFARHILRLKSDFDAFSSHFRWNKTEYLSRKVVRSCKYNWQCNTCAWVQTRLNRRKK